MPTDQPGVVMFMRKPLVLRNHTLRASLRLAAVAAAAGTAFPSLAAAQPSTEAPAKPKISCRAVPVSSSHGGHVEAMSHLARISGGRVLAMNPNTGATTTVRFHSRSGRYVKSVSGARFALAGQAISRTGRPGESYVVAARLNGRSVLCAGRAGLMAVAADTAASEAAAYNLPATGVEEVPLSSTNRGGLLVNDSAQEVCANTRTHPDGARQTRSFPEKKIWCYQGPGAWLNDQYGMERWPNVGPYYGSHITGTLHTHKIVYNNAVIPAAKRPASKPNGEGILNSAILWRGYDPNFRLAPPPAA